MAGRKEQPDPADNQPPGQAQAPQPPPQIPPASQRKQACVLCGRCLDACPLFAATGREELSPRAKFHLAQSLAAQGGALDEKSAVKLIGACLSCGRCVQACPFGLSTPDMVSGLRAAHPGMESFVWRLWVEQAQTLWPLMDTLARHLPRFALPGRAAGLKADLAALHATAPFAPWLAPVSIPDVGQGRRAALFAGCVASHAQTGWTKTAGRLMSALGYSVLSAADFACCGLTLGGAGLKDAQHRMRRHNVTAWRKAGKPLVAVFCATCHAGLAAYAQADLGWQHGEQQAWLAGLAPLAALAAHIGFAPGDNAPDRVVYHTPCHGASAKGDREFLAAALGPLLAAEAKMNPCCGFGGALKLTAPNLSAQVGRRLMEFYAPKAGQQILTGCSGCVVQLRAHAPAGAGVGHWLDSIDY